MDKVICWELYRVISSEHEVIIQFQNSGEDIPSEALVSLFDKFYRADKSRSSDTGGTGLGLAIAKEIVTQEKIVSTVFFP